MWRCRTSSLASVWREPDGSPARYAKQNRGADAAPLAGVWAGVESSAINT